MNPLEYHKQGPGKIRVEAVAAIAGKEELQLAYTPGVAEPCKEIAKDISKVYDYTAKGRMVAVVTDGTAVLGLGDIGPEASLPVMEGKAVLFKQFGGVDAFPIALRTKDVDEIVETIVRISPGFGGINLEDISAPRCFEIERKLRERLDIPVFHDDQHGTAIVVLAGLLNALKLAKKHLAQVRIAISGAGAAGSAIVQLLSLAGATNIIVTDSKGILSSERSDVNEEKQALLKKTNPEDRSGSLADAMRAADVFIGVSEGGIVTRDMVASMNEQAIVFALANPTPEILPEEAKSGGAYVVATGRSDFPNQLNNVLVFPGVFKGLLEAKAKEVTDDIKLAAAQAITDLIEMPTPEMIIPDAFDERVANAVAEAVKASI
ncbi:MAG: NADP-dependent malic enzyme [bacterium]|nr:NADP-dependent malic enzyme [bacterium]